MLYISGIYCQSEDYIYANHYFHIVVEDLPTPLEFNGWNLKNGWWLWESSPNRGENKHI